MVIQSRTTPQRIEREQENFRRAIGGAAEVTFLSTLDERLASTNPEEILKDFGGAIFGGSSDLDFHGGRPATDPVRIISMMILSRARNLVTYILMKKIPLLGICYGHQLVANLYGGQVNHDKEQSKFGSYEVQLTEEGKRDPLFKLLPESFIAQYAHNDSVTQLPTGATLLASADGCKFSALRYGQKAYTLQFHPEVTHFDDLPLEYRDSAEASKIIPLWIAKFVVEEK